MKQGSFLFLQGSRVQGVEGSSENSKCKAQSAKVFAGFIVFMLVVFAHSFVHAALTKQLSYQGRLNNASGQPVANGTYSIVFSIYNVSTGGSALWTETQNVNVESGGFSAYLGSITPLNLLFNEDYFLGIKVGSDPEMTPRLKLAIVGTSAFAFEAGKLEGKAASDFALSTHNHDSNYSASAHTHTATGVTQIVAGTNVSISPSGGTGVVTISATGGGGGSSLTPASTVQPVTSASVVGTSTNYAREDHQHNMVSNFITDSLVSTSAGIATSKLSGTVTAISGHGLGSLATLNAVSGAEIQDGTILFADIASNSCASGQVIEYNGTAWICGTDDVGGGGAVVNNPGATQTIIAGNSSTTPLALKAASAPTAAMFDVQDFAGGSVVKVAPSGNLLVGNPAQIAPKLSVEDTSINPGIAVQQKGTGTALDVWQSGTSGSAGVFSITNAGNTSDLISGDLSGTGSLLKLSLSGINKFVVSKAGDVTATSFTGSGIGLTGVSASDPNAVKTNPSANQIIQPTADIIPLIIRDDAAATAFLFDIQNNAGTTLVRVNETGNLLVGNPAYTGAKVSVEQTGATNPAGYFKINNASSPQQAVYGDTNGTGSAVYGNTNGTGKAGEFAINNVSNSNSAVYAYTNGTGSAIRGNSAGTGNLLQLQQSGINKFVVANNGDVQLAKAGTSVIDVSDAGNTVLNITNSLAGTASLQVEGAAVLTSANGVITNPSAAQVIAPTADATALVLKPGTGAPTLDIFGINNFSDVNLLKVTPTGELLIGSPTTTTAKVSVLETGTANNAGRFEINNASNNDAAVFAGTNGTSYAGYFLINNASSTGSGVYGQTNGAGSGVLSYQTGTGNAGFFQIDNISNTSPVIKATTTGTGNLLQLQQGAVDKFVVENSGNTLIGNPALTTAKVSAQESGATNNAGIFIASNAANADAALYAETYGTGPAINGKTSGTGWAGFFEVANASNSTQVLTSKTNGLGATLNLEINNAINGNQLIFGNIVSGTGELIKLQQGSVNKFVVSNAGSILLDGNANPSIKASGATPNLILDADGTGASIVTVKNTTSPGNVVLQVNGNIMAFSGTNSVPVTGGATQQIIQTGNTCESLAGDQTITLSFTPAFALAPKVVATGTTATAGAGFISSITGASTTGATVNMGGTQTGTIECVDWVAIGNK